MDQELHKRGLGRVSLVKNLSWIDPKQLYLYGFSRGAFYTSLLAKQIEGLRNDPALGSV